MNFRHDMRKYPRAKNKAVSAKRVPVVKATEPVTTQPTITQDRALLQLVREGKMVQAETILAQVEHELGRVSDTAKQRKARKLPPKREKPKEIPESIPAAPIVRVPEPEVDEGLSHLLDEIQSK